MACNTFSDHSIRKILDINHEAPCPPPRTLHRERRRRTQFSVAALKKMEEVFAENQYPDVEAREILALELGVSEAKIQVWFQNKRTRRGCTKSRRGPMSSHHVSKGKQLQADTAPTQSLYPPLPVFPAPMRYPVLDYSPFQWTSALLTAQRSSIKPKNKLKELLVEELRSYESSSSSSDDSQS